MADLSAFLESVIRAKAAPGVSVAASLGDRSLLCAVGHDRPASDPQATRIRTDSVVNVGSVSKCVTGTLIAMTAADGAISIDHPVKTYLPRYSDPDDTIRQLATHTAGYTFNQMERWPETEDDLEEFRSRVYAARPKSHRPVEQMEYWSTGYFVLMEVLETVYGATIDEIVTSRLLRPLGMDRTTFLSRRAQELRRLLPYDLATNRELTGVAHAPPLGETGLWTCAEDLLAFVRGISQGSGVVSERALDLLLRDQSNGGHLKTIGFWMRPQEGSLCPFSPEMSNHAVGHPGYTGCFLAADPESGFYIAITSTSPNLHADFCNYSRIASAALHQLRDS